VTHTESHEDQRRNGGFSLFFAFVGGALLGGAAAVLFAPRSGAETRRRIAGAVGDAKDVASHMPEAIREASSAAQAAFAAALRKSSGEHEQAAARHHS
jgi:gas vesicle protein